MPLSRAGLIHTDTLREEEVAVEDKVGMFKCNENFSNWNEQTSIPEENQATIVSFFNHLATPNAISQPAANKPEPGTTC